METISKELRESIKQELRDELKTELSKNNTREVLKEQLKEINTNASAENISSRTNLLAFIVAMGGALIAAATKTPQMMAFVAVAVFGVFIFGLVRKSNVLFK